MDFYLIADSLFSNKTGVNSFHDAILDACGVSHDEKTLRELFLDLPGYIQQIAFDEGTMADTDFSGHVYLHIKKEGAKYGEA